MKGVSYLSIYVEGAGLLVQIYIRDSRDLTGLLYVGPMSANGQAHQVLPDSKLFMETCCHLSGLLQNIYIDRKQNKCSSTLSWSAIISCRNTYLQMSDGLLVTLNDEEFASEASEVHIIDHIGSLPCYLVHRLTTKKRNMLPVNLQRGTITKTNTRQTCVSEL